MLTKEYRIVMPLTVEEYRIGQLYMVAMQSKHETGGGDGVEVIENRPYDNYPLFNNRFSSGQYTKKKYHMGNKVGGLARALIPKSALIFEENAWNAYPYCKTVITNDYLKDFNVTIESYHLAGNGTQNNVHMLSPQRLKNTEVITIDIAGDVDEGDYSPSQDPKLYKSKKTNRGCLGPNWMHTSDPLMTCYKLVTIDVKYFGVQNKLEEYGHRNEKRLFEKFHRGMFCSMDEWINMGMDDIRKLEDDIKEELEQQRLHGAPRGSLAT